MKHSRAYKFMYVLLIGSVSAAMFYTYSLLSKGQSELLKNLETLYMQQAKELALNYDAEIHRHIHYDLYASLKHNKKLRRELLHALKMLPHSFYQHAYLVYRDKKGVFRYLLGVPEEKELRFNTPLKNKREVLQKTFRSKNDYVELLQHAKSTDVVYVHPLSINKRLQGAVVLEFSFGLFESVEQTLSSVFDIFKAMLLVFLLVFLFLLYQVYLNFKTKKDIYVDALTGAYNRHFLRKFLEDADMNHYQILMLDIDHFKKINDNYGHKAGDFILTEVARIVRSQIRPDDVFIRYGGEEFLLFIHRKSPHQLLAKNIAYRIKNKIQDTLFTYDGIPIKVTVSIGVNCFPEEFPKINDAIKYADEMLYIAKRNGRNQVVSDLKKIENFKVTTKLSLYDVKLALEEKRIVCHYQPVYDTQEKTIAFAEALVRLKDKDDRLLTPDLFLESVEKTNVYQTLMFRVFEIVLATLEESPVGLSINLNVSDIVNDTLYEGILERLQTHEHVCNKLIIELHGDETIAAFEILAKRLEKLRLMKIRIALDNFAARSAFGQYQVFKKLHTDSVHIDGTIVKELAISKTAYKMIKSVLYMAEELELEVVAEHVHSQEIFIRLKELGVRYLQGYFIARPLEKADELILCLKRLEKF